VSSELKTERGHLRQADQDISDGEVRITRQSEVIAALRRSGRDTTLAEQTLLLFEQTLGEWIAHRKLILDRIAYLERNPSDPAP